MAVEKFYVIDHGRYRVAFIDRNAINWKMPVGFVQPNTGAKVNPQPVEPVVDHEAKTAELIEKKAEVKAKRASAAKKADKKKR